MTFPQARRAPLRARRLAGSRDGKGKAWVRFYDGDEAIVGGSRIECASAVASSTPSVKRPSTSTTSRVGRRRRARRRHARGSSRSETSAASRARAPRRPSNRRRPPSSRPRAQQCEHVRLAVRTRPRHRPHAAIFSSNASMRAKPPFAPSSTPYCMVVSRCSVVSKRIVWVSFVCSPRSSNSSVCR